MANINAFMENNEVETIDTSRKLRVGIIGCGGIAKSHVNAYLEMPDVEIVAGCDLVPGKAAAFMRDHGVEGAKTEYKDHREMIDDESLKLDAVSVCTYNRQHKDPTIYALEHGIHVMLEKPFSVTLDEAVEMMRVEKKSGKILSIGFQPRMDANMQMIKKIVQSGELGDVYYIQTGGGRRRGIPFAKDKDSFLRDDTAGLGALADIGCYSLDMVLNAIGYPKPLTVTGYKSAFFGKDRNYSRYQFFGCPEHADVFGVDDFAAAFDRLEGGIILDFRIAWAMNVDTPGDTIILGTKGGWRIPSTDCWNGSVGGPMTIYHEVAGEQVETVVPIIPRPKTTAKNYLFNRKIRTFLDAIKNGTEAPVPTSQIILNQAILDGIARSADLGQEVKIEIPEI